MSQKPEFWNVLDATYGLYLEFLGGKNLFEIHLDYPKETLHLGMEEIIRFWARLAEKAAEAADSHRAMLDLLGWRADFDGYVKVYRMKGKKRK